MDKYVLFMLALSGYVSGVDWQEALKVYSYVSFQSTTLLKYTIPQGVSLVTWKFRASKEQDYCDHQQVEVYLHYGSLPVISPRNETIPDNFYHERTPLWHLQLTSDNASIPLSVSWPTPGPWYLAAFRPEPDSKIQQKGLRVQCDFTISSSMSMDVQSHLETVAMDTDISMVIHNVGRIFRFFVGRSVLQYSIYVWECNQTECDVQLLLHQTNNITSNNSHVCNSYPCTYTVVSPWLEAWHHVTLVSNGGSVSLSWNISTLDCETQDDVSNMSDSRYILYPKLDRYKFSDRDFKAEHLYIVNDTKPTDISVSVVYNTTTVVPFQLHDMVDTGGTLKWTVSMEMEEKTENIQICGQIVYGKIPSFQQDISLICNTSNLLSNQLQINSTSSETESQVYIPYPEPGLWSLAVSLQCYSVDSNAGSFKWIPCSNSSYTISMRVTTDRCVENECGGHGECKEYIVGPTLIVYSTCNCVSGWRGYACSDGSEALSDGAQLEDLLLLALSNLFFLPAIIMAIRRKFYTEAIVYSYNMFFSAMYHACDGDRIQIYKYCLMDYNILSFCDFLSSVCSLWFTMVAMARLQAPMTVALQVTALLVLPIGVLKEHTSLWLIAVPLLSGIIILTVSWGLKCRSRRACYPTRRRYLFCLFPGVVIAVTGASVFAFAETTDNYRYVHSAWHVCLFLSVVFLLPSGRRKGVDIKHSVSDDSIQELTTPSLIHNQVV